MAKKRPTAQTPGFQSIPGLTPAIGSQTPAFQSVPGLTPPIRSGGRGSSPIQRSPSSQPISPPPLPPEVTATVDPTGLIKVTRTAADTPESIRIKQQNKDRQEKEKILAQGGIRLLSDQEKSSIEAEVSSGLTGLGGPEATPTPGEVNAQQRGIAAAAVGLGVTAVTLASGIAVKIGISTKVGRALLHSVGAAGLGAGLLSGRQKVTEAASNFTNSKGIVNEISSLHAQGILSLEQAQIMMAKEFENINRSERTLKILTSDSIQNFLSGGKDELADIVSYRSSEFPLLVKGIAAEEIKRARFQVQ